MGCISSAPINIPDSAVFEVTVLDGDDNPLGKGELYVDTEDVELISSVRTVKWKLKFLRRFGYEKTYFSFEAGRRCGEENRGTFAFRTPKAKELFQMVDYHINQSKRADRDDSQTQLPKSAYAGVDVGKGVTDKQQQQQPAKVSYTQLEFGPKASSKPARTPEKKPSTDYVDLDYDKMDELRDD